jgi:hypothetical protein
MNAGHGHLTVSKSETPHRTVSFRKPKHRRVRWRHTPHPAPSAGAGLPRRAPADGGDGSAGQAMGIAARVGVAHLARPVRAHCWPAVTACPPACSTSGWVSLAAAGLIASTAQGYELDRARLLARCGAGGRSTLGKGLERNTVLDCAYRFWMEARSLDDRLAV